MEENVSYLPTQYEQKILPPIIHNSFKEMNMNEIQNNSQVMSPNNQNIIITNISEYKSTPQPNTKISTVVAPYISSSQPHQSKKSQPVYIQPIITHPLDTSNGINQFPLPQTITKSNISQPLEESTNPHPLDTQIPLTKSLPQPMNHSLINRLNVQSNVEPVANNFENIKIINTKSLMGEVPGALPVYRLIRQGRGINPTEEQGIVFCAMKVFQEQIYPLSNNTAKFIQRKLGGDWLVIVYEQGKPIDFNMTCIEGDDYMYFILDTTAFQVCRLR